MVEETAGERLRNARRKAGLSAGELGRRAGLLLGRDRPISASAVRNQENGTNGIPADTAQAYAELLSVTPGHILWADDEAELAAPIEPDPRDDTWGDVLIPALRIVSGNWLPMQYNPGKTIDDSFIWVGVPGWSAETDGLQALEVIDRTLEPPFRRGTFLIIAPARDATIWDGCYVLASKLQGEEILHAVRQVAEDPAGGVHLFTFGKTEGPQIYLKEPDGSISNDLWLDGVVIASYYQERPKGRGLDIPEPAWRFKKPTPEEEAMSIGEVRSQLRDKSWPSRREDFEGIRLRPTAKEAAEEEE